MKLLTLVLATLATLTLVFAADSNVKSVTDSKRAIESSTVGAPTISSTEVIIEAYPQDPKERAKDIAAAKKLIAAGKTADALMLYVGDKCYDYRRDLGVSDAQCGKAIREILSGLNRQKAILDRDAEKALADPAKAETWFDRFDRYYQDLGRLNAIVQQYLMKARPTRTPCPPATKQPVVKK